MTAFANPILPGFHPDPSICRVGEDYYLATSTFAWVPGLPIYHSRDLVHWRLAGHALPPGPASRLLSGVTSVSDGVFAPTLRWHAGKLHVVFTVVDVRANRFDNYLSQAPSPEGPWTEPVLLADVARIDPDLFFDDDGRVWLCANRHSTHGNPKGGGREIWLTELDAATWQPKGPRYVLWDGAAQATHMPEGPHLFKRDDFYYLLAAEGGTDENHAVVVARSRAVTGPYEGCPANPVLTHRHLGDGIDITCVGHADLVETPDGEGWAVCLGRRPENGYSVLGRETFLLPWSWSRSGWPVFAPGLGRVPVCAAVPKLPLHPWSKVSVFEWCGLRGLPPHEQAASSCRLRLQASPVSLHAASSTPAFLARRVTGRVFTFESAIDLSGMPEGDVAGIALFLHETALLRLDHRFYQGRAESRVVTVDSTGEHVTPWVANGAVRRPVRLRIVSDGQALYVARTDDLSGDDWQDLIGSIELPIFSHERDPSMHFTGLMAGVFAMGRSGCVEFENVRLTCVNPAACLPTSTYDG